MTDEPDFTKLADVLEARFARNGYLYLDDVICALRVAAKAKETEAVTQPVIALVDRIRSHCQSVNGRAVYDPDYSDARIAEEAGIAVHNVRGIREQLFGKLRNPGPTREAEAAVAAEREALVALAKRAEDVEREACARIFDQVRDDTLKTMESNIEYSRRMGRGDDLFSASNQLCRERINRAERAAAAIRARKVVGNG